MRLDYFLIAALAVCCEETILAKNVNQENGVETTPNQVGAEINRNLRSTEATQTNVKTIAKLTSGKAMPYSDNEGRITTSKLAAARTFTKKHPTFIAALKGLGITTAVAGGLILFFGSIGLKTEER
ncbi:Putative RxLR effector [Phytophthora palmivora]|uniref:RxLR effector n=1 Tax=Phytophthora palmivora TaxID=4796 RepID=A0A2P4XWZ5_9STRA|nr:Putative RxLR effector [Phytophthora palmivora]